MLELKSTKLSVMLVGTYTRELESKVLKESKKIAYEAESAST